MDTVDIVSINVDQSLLRLTICLNIEKDRGI